MNLLADNV